MNKNRLKETISSISTNCYDDTQQVTTLYNEWSRLGSFSRIARRLAWSITSISAVVAAIYFSFLASDSSEWFSVLLAVICITAIAVLGCGLIVLLLKPFFWHRRKKAKQIHEQLITAERAVLSTDILSTQQPVSDYLCLQARLQRTEDSNTTADTLCDNYKAVTCEVYNNAVYMRELQMDKDRWGEWCWVMSACLVLIVALAIVVAIAIITVLIFALLLWAVVAFNTSDDTCVYKDYDRGSTMPSNEPSFLRIFFDSFYGRFLHMNKAISAVKATMKENLTRKAAVKLLLQAKGIILPESITLPYWPKLSK